MNHVRQIAANENDLPAGVAIAMSIGDGIGGVLAALALFAAGVLVGWCI